jgi:hypothetical protein
LCRSLDSLSGLGQQRVDLSSTVHLPRNPDDRCAGLLHHFEPRTLGAASSLRFLREVGSFAIRTGLIIGLSGLLLLWLSNRV